MSETFQEMNNIFKAAAKGRNSAGKMLWSLISSCTHPTYSEKTHMSFEYCKDLLDSNDCEISDYRNELENDLKFLQNIIASKMGDEKCVYDIYRKDVDNYFIYFQFPKWFVEALRTYPNLFQFCFEK